MIILSIVLTILLSFTIMENSVADYTEINFENEIIVAVEWSPDGNTLVIGAMDGSVWLYDINEETRLELIGHSSRLYSISWSANGSMLATSADVFRELTNEELIVTENAMSDYDVRGEVIVWGINQQEVISTHSYNAYSIAWHPILPILAIGSDGGEVFLFNPANDEPIQQVRERTPDVQGDQILSLCWVTDTSLLAVLTYSELNLVDTEEVNIIDLDFGAPFHSIDCDSNNEHIVISFGTIWNTPNQERLSRYEDNPENSFAVKWHPINDIIATRGQESIHIWDAITRQTEITLNSSFMDIDWGYTDSISWHPDGTLLAEATQDDFVRIWQIDINND